jgi:hypothetical protein
MFIFDLHKHRLVWHKHCVPQTRLHWNALLLLEALFSSDGGYVAKGATFSIPDIIRRKLSNLSYAHQRH